MRIAARGNVPGMGRRRGPILFLLLLAAGCGVFEPAPKPRLLLLISVDTLRADRLGIYGSDRGLTPRIDALGRESYVFTAAYAPASHTLPSIAALLTGRYPEELGIWSNYSVLTSETPTLAGAFRDAGWRTSAVVSGWVLRAEAGLTVGFDHYDDTLPQVEANRPVPERIGRDTTDAAFAALDACLPDAPSRCFLWVHYQDPHGPYTPPAGHREEHLPLEQEEPDGRRELHVLDGPFDPGGIPEYQYMEGQREVAFYRAGYDGEISYLDEEVGRLLDGLGERSLLERAVIVFTADHGESLGEDDYWFGHGDLLSEVQVRVPLLIHVPGLPARTRADVTSLVDVVPTLADLLLTGSAPGAGPGRKLLRPAAGDEQATIYLATLRGGNVTRTGIVDGEFKYVATLRGEVWDGRLTRRGADDVDLTAPAPHVAHGLRVRLSELMNRYQLMKQESRGQLTEADRKALESLGYLEPDSEG